MQLGCSLISLEEEGEDEKEQVAQRGGRCTMPGNIKGQVGLCSEQPDQVDVPAHWRGLE